MTDFSDIQANLTVIRQRLSIAAHTVNRDPRSLSLIAVSKTHPVSATKAALGSGRALEEIRTLSSVMANGY
jgi:uncharacterized pyridoxal phosphate-containing UPF0001 family protein